MVLNLFASMPDHWTYCDGCSSNSEVACGKTSSRYLYSEADGAMTKVSTALALRVHGVCVYEVPECQYAEVVVESETIVGNFDQLPRFILGVIRLISKPYLESGKRCQ